MQNLPSPIWSPLHPVSDTYTLFVNLSDFLHKSKPFQHTNFLKTTLITTPTSYLIVCYSTLFILHIVLSHILNPFILFHTYSSITHPSHPHITTRTNVPLNMTIFILPDYNLFFRIFLSAPRTFIPLPFLRLNSASCPPPGF